MEMYLRWPTNPYTTLDKEREADHGLRPALRNAAKARCLAACGFLSALMPDEPPGEEIAQRRGGCAQQREGKCRHDNFRKAVD